MLLRKKFVKDGFPIKEGRYIVGYTIKVILPSGDQFTEFAFQANYNEQYSFHEEMTDCSGIEWWFEKVNEPTDEEIEKMSEKEYPNPDDESRIMGLRYGWEAGYKQALKDLNG